MTDEQFSSLLSKLDDLQAIILNIFDIHQSILGYLVVGFSLSSLIFVLFLFYKFLRYFV